jgi:hypothetical protein
MRSLTLDIIVKLVAPPLFLETGSCVYRGDSAASGTGGGSE